VKIRVCWDITRCFLVDNYLRCEAVLDSDDKKITILRNVGEHLTTDWTCLLKELKVQVMPLSKLDVFRCSRHISASDLSMERYMICTYWHVKVRIYLRAEPVMQPLVNQICVVKTGSRAPNEPFLNRSYGSAESRFFRRTQRDAQFKLGRRRGRILSLYCCLRASCELCFLFGNFGSYSAH
jgi:hypothetical protein